MFGSSTDPAHDDADGEGARGEEKHHKESKPMGQQRSSSPQSPHEDAIGSLVPRRTLSYLQSLPTAEAHVDEGFSEPVAAVASEVVQVMAVSDQKPEADPESERSPRASVISVSMYKGQNLSLGIRLKSWGSELLISFVSPNSPLLACLKPNDRLLSLDDHFCARWTPRNAAEYLRQKSGPLSITVENPTGDLDAAEAVIIKTHASSKVGISFSPSAGRLTVKRVFTANEIGSKSVLNPGDFVQAINDIPCADLDAATALDLVRGTPKHVSILVRKSNETVLSVRDMATRYSESSATDAFGTSPQTLIASAVDVDDLEAGITARPSLVSVKVSRHSRDVAFGISFKSVNDELRITKVREVGLLSTSILKAGMNLVSLNNVNIAEWSSKQAIAYFKDATGEVLIVARDSTGDPLQVAASAHKHSPRALAGFRFRSASGRIQFSKIAPDGIFADSVLNEADTVLFINNLSYNHMTTSEAAALVKNEPSLITIHARTHESTGIVISKYGSSEQPRTPGPQGDALDNTTDANKNSCTAAVFCFGVIFIVMIIASSAAGGGAV